MPKLPGFVLTLVLLVAAGPVAAQTHSSSVGLNVGVVMYSAFNSGATGATVDLKPSPDIMGGVQYDWFLGSGNLGFRFAGHYQRMQMDWNNGERDIFAYAGDFDALIRPIRPDVDTKVIPYLSLGVGFTHYRFGNGNPTGYGPGAVVFEGNESTQFSVLGGIGFDIMTGWHWDEGNFLIRIEAQDNYVLESPFQPIEGSSELGGVHNLRIMIGLHNTMGGLVP